MFLDIIRSMEKVEEGPTLSLFEIVVWIFDIICYLFIGAYLSNNEWLVGITGNLWGLTPIALSLFIISSLMFKMDNLHFVDPIISKLMFYMPRTFRFPLIGLLFGTSPINLSDFDKLCILEFPWLYILSY
jgi:hypothetical protein